MSDSRVEIDLGTSGTYVDAVQVVTTDGTVQRQRISVADAVNPEYNWVINADGSASVAGNVTVSGSVSTLNPVASVSVQNFPATQNVNVTAGSVGVTNFPGSFVVSGSVSVLNESGGGGTSSSVSVLNFPSTQTVAGSVYVINESGGGGSNVNVTNAYIPVTQQGNWGASISNIVPVSQSGAPWVIDAIQQGNWGASVSNFPANQTVSGSVSVNNGHILIDNATLAVTQSGAPWTVGAIQQGNWGASISNVVPVSQSGAPWSVDAIQQGNWGASVSNFPANQTVSGSVSVNNGHILVDNFPATQPVSGSVSVLQAGPWSEIVSGSVSSLQAGTWYTTVSGSVSVLNQSGSSGSSSVSVLNGSINIADPTTPTQKLAVNAAGQITESNSASVLAYTEITGIPRIKDAIGNSFGTLSSNQVATWGLSSTLAQPVASSGSVTVVTNAAVGPTNTTSNGVTGASVSASQTTVTLTTVNGFGPPIAPYVIGIDSEQMLVTGGVGTTTLTVVRAYNGTTAATHVVGATITANNCFTFIVDSEIMVGVLGLASASVTVPSQGRGYNGTVAASHNIGATFSSLVTPLGAIFTPNEIEIINRNGSAEILYTLDGSTPSYDNFQGILVAAPGSIIIPFDASLTQKPQFVSPGGPTLAVAIRGL